MNERLAFLLRKNKGSIILHEYIASLSNYGGLNIAEADFVKLECSDKLFADYCSNGVVTKQIEVDEIDKLTNYLNIILNHDYRGENTYLWTRMTEYCGLLRLHQELNTQNILGLFENEFIGGMFTIYFPDGYISFDKNEDFGKDNIYKWIYSIVEKKYCKIEI